MCGRYLWLTGLIAAIALGCSQGAVVVSTHPVAADAEKLLKIGQAYHQFNRDKHRPPASKTDLESILKSRGATDELFTSTRDGEPFVICWGVSMIGVPDWGKSRPVLAYEHKGLDGSRYVLTTFGNVELLAEEQFEQSGFAPGREPSR